MERDPISVPADELAQMLLSYFRYALGRKTYVTDKCAGSLQRYWHVLPDGWKTQIHGDINKAIARGDAGHGCDIAAWMRVLDLPISPSEAK